MKKLQITFTVLFLTIILGSCSTTKILQTNFSEGTLGNAPAHDIPGDPSGDFIGYIPDLAPALKIVNWSAGDGKALEFKSRYLPNVSGHNTWLSFTGVSTNFRETIWYMYAAKHSGTNGNIIIDLTDGSGTLIARMTTRSDGTTTLQNRDWITSRNIGVIPPNVYHTVIFAVSVTNRTFNLLIVGGGMEQIELNDVPLFTDNILDFHNPATPQLGINFDQAGDNTRTFELKTLLITRKNPTRN